MIATIFVAQFLNIRISSCLAYLIILQLIVKVTITVLNKSIDLILKAR